ncbi:uncharacterized protein LOC123320455 [Coccinella septempunctata]|uniref:uncharacterized protein LOC123320455 n=1 Tax=Coccinella septempunctata TaxID=41139 RepID=UPI001D061C6E|nr:uncharacterized protein LOC123320455 [Coccinella septempunctata]
MLSFGFLFYTMINSTERIGVWQKLCVVLNIAMITITVAQFSIYASVINANMEMLQNQLESLHKSSERKFTLSTEIFLNMKMLKNVIDASDTLNSVYGLKVDCYIFLFLISTLFEIEMTLDSLAKSTVMGRHIYNIIFIQILLGITLYPSQEIHFNMSRIYSTIVQIVNTFTVEGVQQFNSRMRRELHLAMDILSVKTYCDAYFGVLLAGPISIYTIWYYFVVYIMVRVGS